MDPIEDALLPNIMLEQVEGEYLLFMIKHPCNLGSGVTNLLLTCIQSDLPENRKGIGRKY